VSLKLYVDEHVASAITEGLRQRGVDVLTAQEDGQDGVDDPVLLDRATALGRVLFTQDTDLLAEGTRRQRTGEPFAGIVYAHQVRVTIGRCVQDLELLAGASHPGEFVGQVVYLPLR
jgi:predicted nuclease of predicted toxin-antitoxin system